MANHSDAQITVVYPITELRAEAADCLRTWTHGQTLARERYRVVAAFDGTDASQHPELLSLLGPGDELLPVPGANTSAILNAAAARAGTPWLLFTEGHCMGDPGCLAAVARWIADHPGAVVGNVDLRHRDDTLLARISARWYDTIEKRWRAPDDWPRVIVGGFAIRADVFSAVGGFEPEYRLFAPPLMSARLHARGMRIEVIPGASVLHVDVEDMRGPPRGHRALRPRRVRCARPCRPDVHGALLRPCAAMGQSAPRASRNGAVDDAGGARGRQGASRQNLAARHRIASTGGAARRHRLARRASSLRRPPR